MDLSQVILPSADKLSKELALCRDPGIQARLLASLLSQYVYTRLDLVPALLLKMRKLPGFSENPSWQLSFNRFRALAENQGYNFRSADTFFRKAILLASSTGDTAQHAALAIDFVGTCINRNRMEEAEQVLEKARRLLRKQPQPAYQARMLSREAFIRLHYADYPRAIEAFRKAEKAISQLPPDGITHEDLFFLQIVQAGLGNLYDRIGEAQKSVDAYRKAIALAEFSGIRTRISWLYLLAGKGCLAQADYAGASRFFQQVLDLPEGGEGIARGSAQANVGYIHLLEGHATQALSYFQEAERLFRQGGERDSENLVLLETWRGQLAVKAKASGEAEAHFLRAYQMAAKAGNLRQLAALCQELATLHANGGAYAEAYSYEKQHAAFAAKAVEELNQHKIWELEAKYDAERRKQEAELLVLQSTRLQLKALRAQMNPHFLYNALNSIQHYITSNDMEPAARYLAKFAKLMRQSLELSDHEVIPLEKEIEFLENYLYINEKLRFDNRMSYRITVAEDLEEDLIGVPAMIVQPYLENALEHGFRSRKDGFLSVDFMYFDEKSVRCIIKDNGIGRARAQLLQRDSLPYREHQSRGTAITEQRLQLLQKSTGAKASVTITDLKHPSTGEATGTRVEVIIPLMDLDLPR